MNFRKIISIGLISTSLFLMLVGCGASTPKPLPSDKVGPTESMSSLKDAIEPEKDTTTDIEQSPNLDADLTSDESEPIDTQDTSQEEDNSRILVSTAPLIEKSSVLVDTIYNESKGNTLYSPLSFNFALGLASNGMTDEGKLVVSDYLGRDISDFNELVKNYMMTLPNEVEIANGIFVEDTAELQDSMTEYAHNFYDAEIGNANLDTEEGIQIVNKWCSEKTHGMIPKLFDAPLPSTQATILNSLYFEDKWAIELEEDNIDTNGFFTNLSDETQDCVMLNTTEHDYLSNDYAEGFIKYYKNNRYGFVGILPKENGDFNLQDLDINTLMQNHSKNDVIVEIPEFTFEARENLTDLLSNNGLSAIIGTPVLDKLIKDDVSVISQIIQGAKIEVNRNGTKAAAVTAIVAKNGVAPMPEDTKFVFLNRPFAFMIYDFEADTPLFIGKVVNM